MPISAAPVEFLTVAEQADLIAAAQDVPAILAVQDDGTEVTKYLPTPASEAATDALVRAFLPALERAAHLAKVIDLDDAFSAATEEFMLAIHEHDTTSTLPFSATIATRLRFAVLRADLRHDVIRLPRTAIKTYFRYLHAHGGDVSAAYSDVKANDPEMHGSTFLAIHHVVGGMGNLDPVTAADEGFGAGYNAAAIDSHEIAVATAAEVEWLFTKVAPEEETVLRLAYGFRDEATENLRVEAGFQIGECLSATEISGTAVGGGKATVNRRRASGLAKMRDALVERASEAV